MSARGASRGEGELAIVLHSHQPYVAGFGTWPFGEEWLWESIATSYLPLLDILDARRAAHAVADAGALRPARGAGRARALRGSSSPRSASSRTAATSRARGGRRRRRRRARALRGALRVGARAARRRAGRRRGGLLGALGRHAAWTSSATHAVLPLLATDAGVRLQLRAGIDAHRARFGARTGAAGCGCRSAPTRRGWTRCSQAAGVRAVCVDLTDVLAPDEHLRPLRSPAGPLLVPIDRATIELVWSRDGYPRDAALSQLPRVHAAPPPRVEQRRRALRPGARRRGRPRARRGLRRARARAGRAAAACASSPSTPSCSATGGTRARSGWRRCSARRRRRACRSPASTTRSPATPPRRRARPGGPARHLVGHAARPDDLERAAGRRHGVERARRRAAHGRRRARRRAPTRAPSASCSRCSPATGRFSSAPTSPRRTAASARRTTAPRSTPRSRPPARTTRHVRNLAP